MVPQVQDISHFRAPYKDAYFSGMGDAASDAAALNAISTVTPNGVRVLTPAGALALTPLLQGSPFVILTTAPDKEQILLQAFSAASPAPAGTSAMDWVNAQMARGRSVIVSTNTPGGLPATLAGATPGQVGAPSLAGQVVLAAVSTPADELAGAGANTGAALVAPSKLTAAGAPLVAASMSGLSGPIGIAILALAVAGGVYFVFRKKPRTHEPR